MFKNGEDDKVSAKSGMCFFGFNPQLAPRHLKCIIRSESNLIKMNSNKVKPKSEEPP